MCTNIFTWIGLYFRQLLRPSSDQMLLMKIANHQFTPVPQGGDLSDAHHSLQSLQPQEMVQGRDTFQGERFSIHAFSSYKNEPRDFRPCPSEVLQGSQSATMRPTGQKQQVWETPRKPVCCLNTWIRGSSLQIYPHLCWGLVSDQIQH